MNITVRTWQESEARGHPYSLLQTMQNLNTLFAKTGGRLGLDYAEIAESYLAGLDP